MVVLANLTETPVKEPKEVANGMSQGLKQVRKKHGRGHPLSLHDLEWLKGKVTERLSQLLDGYDEQDYNNSDFPIDKDTFERCEERLGERSVREELIGKIPRRDLWIKEVAETISVDSRSVRNYVLSPKDLDDRITFLKKGSETAKVLQGEARQVYVEGVRLLSTTLHDLVRYLPSYIPYNHPYLGTTVERPKMSVRVSQSTFRNEAMRCFDTTGSMTIRELKANAVLQETIKDSLRDWPVGTVGVHAVDVVWQMDHEGDRTRTQGGKKGGTIRLLLMAERRCANDREIGFSPIPSGAPEGDMAQEVKAFLMSLKLPTGHVCLATELRDGQVVPTAVSAPVLTQTLGSEITVTLDTPTRGLGPIRVPGRFKSEDEVYAYLEDLLNLPPFFPTT